MRQNIFARWNEAANYLEVCHQTHYQLIYKENMTKIIYSVKNTCYQISFCCTKWITVKGKMINSYLFK